MKTYMKLYSKGAIIKKAPASKQEPLPYIKNTKSLYVIKILKRLYLWYSQLCHSITANYFRNRLDYSAKTVYIHIEIIEETDDIKIKTRTGIHCIIRGFYSVNIENVESTVKNSYRFTRFYSWCFLNYNNNISHD